MSNSQPNTNDGLLCVVKCVLLWQRGGSYTFVYDEQ